MKKKTEAFIKSTSTQEDTHLFCFFSSGETAASDSGCSPHSSTRSAQMRTDETASGRLYDCPDSR